jgi:hypothetical protein
MLEVNPGECSKLNAEMETIGRVLLITIINPSPHGKQTRKVRGGRKPLLSPEGCGL